MSFWDKFKTRKGYDISNLDVIENVKKAGYEVIEADDTHLLLDLDTEAQYKHFLAVFRTFLEYIGPASYEERWSISGPPKRHVIVTLSQPMDAVERVAWQACMGSDTMKETLNLLGVLLDLDHVIVLFNKKRGTRRGVTKIPTSPVSPMGDDTPF